MILLLLLVLNQPVYNATDVLEAPIGLKHEATITRIFRTEIGGHYYNPYVIHSDTRCVGPGGLCSFGLLPEYYRRGYTDPHNPYDVAEYINWVLENNRACNWPYLCR